MKLQYKKERKKSGRQLWDEAISFVVHKVLHCGSKPLLPIEDLPITEKFFHRCSGEYVDLSLPVFTKIFVDYFRQRLGRNACPSTGRITEWFREIDADCSNGVSWEEFSSFNISTATTQDSENVRAREVLEDPGVKSRSHANEHHFPISHLDANASSPFVVSSADDGMVKLWNAADGSFAYSINNNLVAASHPRIRAGASSPVHPIVDVRFDARGGGCFVTSTDKSVHVYDGSTFELVRKYVGTQVATPDSSGEWRNTLGSKSVLDASDKFKLAHDVEATLLLDFRDCPTTMDVAAPSSGREVLLFGTDCGEIMIFPSMRNVHIPDISPACRYHPHTENISKLRYLARIDSIATASWDSNVLLLDVETGQTKMRYQGHKVKSSTGHNNSSFRQPINDGDDDDADCLGHSKIVLDFAYDSVQNLIASAGMDRSVLLWSTTYNHALCALQGHSAPLRAVSFAEDDRLLFSMDQAGVVLSWDLRMNRVLQTVGCELANEDELDTTLSDNKRMSAFVYDASRSKLFCGNVSVKSWTMRRALGGFPASHIGHVDNIIAFSIVSETSSIISTDRQSTMRWNALRGSRRCMWTTEAKDVELAAVATDSTGRKLIAVDEDGTVMFQNAANGLVLRSADMSRYITATPFRVLTKKGGCIVIVTPNEALVFTEDSLNSLSNCPPQVVQAPRDSCFTAAALPPVGGVVLGTSTGALLSFMVSRDPVPIIVVMHPRVLKTRQSRSRQSRTRVSFPAHIIDSRSGRRKTQSKGVSEEPAPRMTLPTSSAVEDICFLPYCELLATCTGDGHIYFWDSSASVLKATYTTNLKPEECLLCLSTCEVHADIATIASASAGRRRSLLISSCDWGFVYVRDATSLPNQGSALAEFTFLNMPLLHVFRAHGDPVTQLAPFPKYNVIVTLSAYDSMIKLFSLDGKLVGYLGQEEAWHLKDQRTFGRNTRAVPLDDGVAPPRPSTVNARPLLTTPDSGITSFCGEPTFLTGSKLQLDQFVSVLEDAEQRRTSEETFSRRVVSLSNGGLFDDCSSPVAKGSGLLRASLSQKKRFTPAEAQNHLGLNGRIRRLASLGTIPDPRAPDCELLVPVQLKKEGPRRLSTLPQRSQSTDPRPSYRRVLDPIQSSLSRSLSLRQSSIGLLHQAVTVEQELFSKKLVKGDLTDNLIVRNKLMRDNGCENFANEWSTRASALLAIHDVPASTLLSGSPLKNSRPPRAL